MLYYKGFDKNMQCRGFQYVEGETYEQAESPVVCKSGFHACGLPLATFSFYPPCDGNQYGQVYLEDVTEESADSKVAARVITVGASVNVFGLVKAHVEAIWNRATDQKKASPDAQATTGYKANAATTGDGAHAATTGYRAHAATTGDGAHAATTGYGANAATTGDWANAATTGDWAHAATTGDRANAATTGDRAHAATTGDWANAATTGNCFVSAEATGSNAVAAVLGRGKAKAALGCWLVLTERDDDLNILGVQAVQVDGETIKPGVYYTLKGGEIVEAE